MQTSSPLSTSSHPARSILVVDPSPTTQAALRWACAGCTVQAFSSVEAALEHLERPYVMVVVEVSLAGVEALYDRASPALRERLVFVGSSPIPRERHAFIRERGAVLLYRPLSPQTLTTIYEALVSLPAG